MNTFIQQEPIEIIKSDSKDIYNVTKYLCISVCKLFHGFPKNIKQHVRRCAGCRRKGQKELNVDALFTNLTYRDKGKHSRTSVHTTKHED